MNRKERRAQKGGGGGPAGADRATLFAAATRHHQAGRLGEAETLYRRLLAADPRHADSLHRLGLIGYQIGQADIALDLVQRALAIDPKGEGYQALLSLALTDLGRLEEAAAAGRLAVRQAPQRPDYHSNLGHILAQLGQLEAAADSCARAAALAPDDPEIHRNLAAVSHRLGRLEAAADSYRRVVVLAAGDAAAHTSLGNALQDLGLGEAALAAHRHAIALSPQLADAHNNLGEALWRQGDLDAAEAPLRRAIALDPKFVLAHSNLAGVLKARGRLDEAVASLSLAAALAPTHAEVLNNLALALMAQGRGAEAMRAILASLQSRVTAENRATFVQCAKDLDVGDDAAVLAPWLTRAVLEAWGRPESLVRIGLDVAKRHSATARCLVLGEAGWAAASSASIGVDDMAGLADNALLLALLTATPNIDMGLERALTLGRTGLLAFAEADERDLSPPALAVAAALAQQSFINEYVFRLEPQEASRADALCAAIASDLAAGRPISTARLLAAACYAPLYSLPAPQRLLDRPWPAPIAAVLKQQISEPAEEAALRAGMPQLTPIVDPASREVQGQYEQNPYPRWTRTETGRAPQPLIDHLLAAYPLSGLQRFEARDRLDVLIAGCGTGRSAVELAGMFEGARVLAIDLSLASLAHAARKGREAGVEVEYGQADLLEIGRLGRRFDLIESSGVLHHLQDPFAGWRALVSVLAPRGVMKIALYSAVARRNLPAPRLGGASADDIRAMRQQIAGRDDERAGEALGAQDFYSLSACRDLLLHVQEQRLTLAQIEGFLREAGLRFLGFILDDSVIFAYRQRFPDDPAAVDLKQWALFEQDEPETFTAMYQFWVQKI